MFKDNIKPIWEDENNKKGGRFSIRVKKEYSSLVWEELIFNFIGNHFPKEIKDEVNGMLISNRRDYTYIHIWFRNYDTQIIKEIQ
mgnify:CR=1 FL=1